MARISKEGVENFVFLCQIYFCEKQYCQCLTSVVTGQLDPGWNLNTIWPIPSCPQVLRGLAGSELVRVTSGSDDPALTHRVTQIS